jgi:hypothetical protein
MEVLKSRPRKIGDEGVKRSHVVVKFKEHGKD